MSKFNESVDDLLGSNKGKHMTPEVVKAVDDLVTAFNNWRYAGMTVFSDIKPAQKDLISYIEKKLKKG